VNRLAGETSPYLLQHAANPVDWFCWGEEAFAAARDRDVAVLLSVGYSSCHWCHVMAHESFEDPAVAALMNELFVNVKVDREERPDVDAIYMDAVVAQTGHGGWPMTVFMTPDGRPFWGGTYLPPVARQGMPSFSQVLGAIAEAYRGRRGEILTQAGRLTEAIGGLARGEAAAEAVAGETVVAALGALRNQFDPVHAGFGGAPKFPPSALLPSLLGLGQRGYAEQMAVATLDAMAAGGIHDQLGGGFHRYAVDGVWLVPHFEKMLYDNALLARAFAVASVVTGEDRFADVARSTLDYLDRELRVEGGGVASSQDADTDGEEGLTFVWTPAQVEAVVGVEAARVVCDRYGIVPGGNFEGSSVLSVVGALRSAEDAAVLQAARGALLEARDRRPQPSRDDKAIAAWNGFALAAYAEAGRLLGEAAFVARAREIAGFLLGPMSAPSGRLFRTRRAGVAKIDAFAEDYGAVADGLIALHAATGELRWLDEARRLTALSLELFDDGGGAFLQAPRDGERLVARRRDADDNPTPAGSSLLAGNLLRLGRIYGDRAWEDRAADAVAAMGGLIGRVPHAFGHLLGVLHQLVVPSREIAVLGHADDPRTYALRRVLDAGWDPATVVVIADPRDPLASTVPLLEGRGLVNGRPAAYVCERFVCLRPITDPAELVTVLAGPSTD
jgi:uncharacterized protein YyaL (SSP411 family)